MRRRNFTAPSAREVFRVMFSRICGQHLTPASHRMIRPPTGREMLLVKKSKRSKIVLPPKKVTSESLPNERQGRAPTTASASVESMAAPARFILCSSTRKATTISIIETDDVMAATAMHR